MAFYEKNWANLVKDFDLYDFTWNNPDLKDCHLKLEISKWERGKNDWVLRHTITRYDLPLARKESAFTTQDEAKKYWMWLADWYRCWANMMKWVIIAAAMEREGLSKKRLEEELKNRRE